MRQRNTAQDVENVIRDLHEEALQSIRQRSSIAAEEVATAYVELWLSWAEAWSKYGQTLRGGILRNFDPLRLGHTSGLGRNLYGSIQQAVDAGLRDHVSAFRGVILRVTSQAIALKAPDLVDEMLQMARSFLTFSSDDRPDLAISMQDRGWRFQTEICRFYMEPAFDSAIEPPDIDLSAAYIESCYRSLVKSLRILYNNRFFSKVKEVDGAFCDLLQFPSPSDNVYIAASILRDKGSHDKEAVRRAEATLHRMECRRSLEEVRRAGRLALLGWMLQHSKDHALVTQEESDLLNYYAGGLGSLAEVVDTVDPALRIENDSPFDWIPAAQSNAEILRIDEAVLSAMVFALLFSSSPIPTNIEPAPWMTDTRLSLLGDKIDEWVSSKLWEKLDSTVSPNLSSRAAGIKDSFQIAQQQQADTERDTLIKASLDSSKIDTFRHAAITGWQNQRQLEAYANTSGLRLEVRSRQELGESRLGIFPLPLLPKGLFVTPTNWMGTETTGRDYGEAIARGEVERIVHHVQEESALVSSVGTALERIIRLKSLLQGEGKNPSLVLLPYNWRLAQDLKLEMWREPNDPFQIEKPFIGIIEGMPVTWHSQLEKDKMYIVDLRRLCYVEETAIGKNHSGAEQLPSPPKVRVTPITEKRANEIAEQSPDTTETSAQRQERVLKILTNVILEIYRPYRIVLDDRKAVLATHIPVELCVD